MKKFLVKKSQRETAIFDKARDYLKLPYARILIPEEDGTFSAEVLEFPGCYSQGKSAGEAFDNLEKAAAGWIAACQELGQEIPPPSANQGYGGRIALRLPRGLHRLAARKAQRDGISLNQCLVTAVATWVGADNLYERLTHKVEMNFVHANIIVTPLSSEIARSTMSGSWFLPSNMAAVIPHMVRDVLVANTESQVSRSAPITELTIGGSNG